MSFDAVSCSCDWHLCHLKHLCPAVNHVLVSDKNTGAVSENGNTVMEYMAACNCRPLLQTTLWIIFLCLFTFSGCKTLKKNIVSLSSDYNTNVWLWDQTILCLKDLQLVILAFHQISDMKPGSTGGIFWYVFRSALYVLWSAQ